MTNILTKVCPATGLKIYRDQAGQHCVADAGEGCYTGPQCIPGMPALMGRGTLVYFLSIGTQSELSTVFPWCCGNHSSPTEKSNVDAVQGCILSFDLCEGTEIQPSITTVEGIGQPQMHLLLFLLSWSILETS